ncbi:MAG: UbiA family prenyltransferase [Bacteroidales bacterium]|nr:UbiA family prenyltransferase [Bacteroidales bacterium]
MKVLGFIIHSNILIALAALALTLATQVQLGLEPRAHAYLAVIFLATLFDYNLHRYLTLYNKPKAAKNEKLKWASDHRTLFLALFISSFIGLVIALFFVKTRILFLLLPLALLSFLYSYPGKQKHRFRLLRITGMKTILIALVWSSATVLIPIFSEKQSFDFTQIVLLFAECFTFIFAIAIPFDIRDVETDRISSLKTIPIHFGEINALKISNIVLLLSLSFAAFHYLNSNLAFILPGYLLSIIITFIFINNKSLKNTTFYHHGILDGCILLHGMMIFMSDYFKF